MNRADINAFPAYHPEYTEFAPGGGMGQRWVPAGITGGMSIRELFAKDIFCAFIARGHRYEKAREQAVEHADLLLSELAKVKP